MSGMLVKAGIILAPVFLAAAKPVIEKIGQGVERVVEAASDLAVNKINSANTSGTAAPATQPI